MTTLEHQKISPRSIKKSEAHWSESVGFYYRNKPRLLRDKRYRGKFIGIRNGRIVGVANEQFALAHKLLKEFPDRIFFVTRVTKDEPVYDVPSIVLTK